MFHIDPNVNAAVARQAERVRAVRSVGASFEPERAVEESDRPQQIRRRAVLALAAAAPIVVLVATVVVVIAR